MSKEPKKKVNKSAFFEQNLNKLEKLVEAMENDTLTLENSLKNFEEGVKLTRECQQALENATQQVEILIKKEEGFLTKSFEGDHE